MAEDDELSDYLDEEDAEEEEDDEATLDEEDAFNESNDDDYSNELRELQEESGLSLEQLQRKYCGGEGKCDGDADVLEALPSPSSVRSLREDGPSSSSVNGFRGRIFSAIAGTCGQLTQTLGAYFKSEDLEEDDTEDYMPPELWKKSIRVGEQFQVGALPKPMHQDFADEHLVEKLWAPSDDLCQEATLVAFLLDCERIRAGGKPNRTQTTSPLSTTVAADGCHSATVPDDEDALLALFQANYDPKAAKEKLRVEDGGLPFFEPANAPQRTQSSRANGGQQTRHTIWTDVECEQFERGMTQYDKCFWKIRREYVPNRTAGELVTFYYSWKKSERYDLWKIEKSGREQNQLDARTTDLMGQLADSLLHGERNATDGRKEAPQLLQMNNNTHSQRHQQQNGVSGPSVNEEEK